MVGDAPFDSDIEGLSEAQFELVVDCGVADAVLAEELRIALAVLAIDAHHAGGQGQAQGRLAVGKAKQQLGLGLAGS